MHARLVPHTTNQHMLLSASIYPAAHVARTSDLYRLAGQALMVLAVSSQTTRGPGLLFRAAAAIYRFVADTFKCVP